MHKKNLKLSKRLKGSGRVGDNSKNKTTTKKERRAKNTNPRMMRGN